MKLYSKTFNAEYSACSFTWAILLDEIEFEVRYLIGFEGLKTTIQVVEGKEVDLEWNGNILSIVGWKEINCIHREDLYNPDKPRNLAKTVTVK